LRAVVVSDGSVKKHTNISMRRIQSLLDAGFVWLDCSSSEKGIEGLSQRIDFLPRVLEQYRKEKRVRHRTLERGLVIILQELVLREGLKTSPILLFLDENLAVTIHEHSAACDQIYRNISGLIPVYGIYKPCLILYMLASIVSESYPKNPNAVE